MKKIIIALALSFGILSCSVEEGDSYSLVVLPVAKVEMETAFAKDSTTTIDVKYLRPSKCYFFEDFYYQKQDLNRVVAIYNAKLNRDDCQVVQNDSVTVPLKFRPTELGTYTFKFWKGTNAQGVDEFYEYQAVVNH